jgi:tetratricopeptide (TPR) repeat protein
MFDYQLHGLNAGGYHVTNLILHILSTLLLFWLFNRMTGAIWKSAFVAAFFALHPLHVESVAWIAERKDVLSAFFWMLTLCLYVYYTEKPVMKRYLPVVFCFVLALMSKPMVVTLPVIMILLDYWPLERLQSQKVTTNLTNAMPVSTNQSIQETKPEEGTLNESISPPNKWKLPKTRIAEIIPLWQIWEKIPFFVLSAVFVFITFYNPSQPKTSLKVFSLSSRLANAPVAFVTYLEKTFWPHDMAVFYPFSDQLPVWQVLEATILIIIISVTVIVMAKRLPYLFVGWMWYSITLLPVIGIIQVSLTTPYSMADRYHYLPSIGIAVMLAWSIPLLFKHKDIRRKILFPAAIAALSIMAVFTWQQCGYWKNSIELFSHALQITKDNAIIYNYLGKTLLAEGKPQEAIDHYNKAIRLKPDNDYGYINRGIAYAELGQYQMAIEDYNKAIRLKPNNNEASEAYNNRGNVYVKLGQHQRALEDFNKAIRFRPGDAYAYNDRGIAYGKLGQYQRALKDFNEAIRLKPDYAKAYNNRALVYFNQKNIFSGCSNAQKACALGNCKILEDAKGKGVCH